MGIEFLKLPTVPIKEASHPMDGIGIPILPNDRGKLMTTWAWRLNEDPKICFRLASTALSKAQIP